MIGYRSIIKGLISKYVPEFKGNKANFNHLIE